MNKTWFFVGLIICNAVWMGLFVSEIFQTHKAKHNAYRDGHEAASTYYQEKINRSYDAWTKLIEVEKQQVKEMEFSRGVTAGYMLAKAYCLRQMDIPAKPPEEFAKRAYNEKMVWFDPGDAYRIMMEIKPPIQTPKDNPNLGP